MKVAVIGNGNVGMAAFGELLRMPEIRELALVGRNVERIRAEVEDYADAQVLHTAPGVKLSGGGYEKTAGADILLYTAGAAQKPGQTRLELAAENVRITRQIFGEVSRYNRDGIVICLSNPVDLITAVVRDCTGRPPEKVIGTGTLLDTARLKKYLSNLLDVSSASVTAYVLGEHGDSSCVIWSATRISGQPVDSYLSFSLEDEAHIRRQTMAGMVRGSAGKLIRAKGSTAYGVAAAAGRLVQAIIHDTRDVLTVSVELGGAYGKNGLAISVPCIVDRQGARVAAELPMSEDERQAFDASADVVAAITKNFIEKGSDGNDEIQ